MTHKKTKRAAKRKATAKKDTQPKRVMASADVLANANARIRSAQGSYYDSDSIERRIDDYSPILGHDVLTLEFGSLDRNNGEYARTLRRLACNDKIHHNIIAQCQVAYINYGILRSVIDLFADFASEGLDIVHENKQVENFYRVWAKKVSLRERVNRFLTDRSLSGQVFIYKINAKINPSEERDMKRGKAEEYELIGDNTILLRGKGKLKDHLISPKIVCDKELMHLSALKNVAMKQAKNGTVTRIEDGRPPKAATEDDPEPVESRVIPWEYISLSPLQMETRGRDLSSKGEWIFALNKEDTENMYQYLNFVYNRRLRETRVELPEHLKGKVRPYKGVSPGLYEAEIVMGPDDLTVIHDKKFDHWAWAVPFAYPSLKHFRFKDYLRNMEIKYCKSVINSVTLWVLGDPDNGIFPEDEHFERLADMLQQPGQSMNILWAAPIDAKVIEPKMNNALDGKKHESVDKDILNSLGIPDVLIGGKGSNFSNSFIAVAGTLKKLEVARQQFEAWLMSELKDIAEAMGFRKLPTIRWKRSSLRDSKAQQQFKLNLFDRGILSAEALLIEADEDIEVEVERQEKEKKVADGSGVGVLDKRGPYFRPEELAKLGIFPYGWEQNRNMEDIKMEDAKIEVEKQKMIQDAMPAKDNDGDDSKTDKGPNGRPPGKQDTKDRKDREAKPKTVDAKQIIRFHSLKEKCSQLLSDIEEKIRDGRENASGGVSEKLVFAIASNMSPKYTQSVIGSQVNDAKSKDYSINNDIKSLYDETYKHFKLQSVNSKITKAERYNLFASAWAAYYTTS